MATRIQIKNVGSGLLWDILSPDELYRSEDIKIEINPEFDDEIFLLPRRRIWIQGKEYLIKDVVVTVYKPESETTDIEVFCDPQ